jgi:hypothetical protein
MSRGPTSQATFTTQQSRPPCQICGKMSHLALDCFHRMDYAYQGCHPLVQLAAMAAYATTQPDDDFP